MSAGGGAMRPKRLDTSCLFAVGRAGRPGRRSGSRECNWKRWRLLLIKMSNNSASKAWGFCARHSAAALVHVLARNSAHKKTSAGLASAARRDAGGARAASAPAASTRVLHERALPHHPQARPGACARARSTLATHAMPSLARVDARGRVALFFYWPLLPALPLPARRARLCASRLRHRWVVAR